MALFELDDVFTYQDANDIKRFWASDTAPTGPGDGEMWLDTSGSTYRLKRYNGSDWDVLAGFTAAELLEKIKSVDGSGSGLDADTVDGLDSSGLVQTSGTQTVAGTKTFTGQTSLGFPVIPLSKPAGAVNGTIWIE